MAREKHIVDLTIGNFKRFADFEVKNLGQFNLIVGDNNTGKTSFLEALLFDEEDDIFNLIADIVNSVYRRSQEDSSNVDKKEIYNAFLLLLNRQQELKSISVSIKKIDVTYDISLRNFNHEADFYVLNSFEKEKLLSSNELQYEFVLSINNSVSTTFSPKSIHRYYSPFVAFGLGHDEHLRDYYSEYIDINKTTRDRFIEQLDCLIPKVSDVRVGNNVINIYEEGMDTPMPLFTYGEGANKLFRILCEIAICQGKRLMIDEIDAGIHHSRFKSFWRTILQAAKAYDVQIFATTHNIECVDYFREVLGSPSELETAEESLKEYQDLARIVSLKVKEDNSVKARLYDYEYMEYAKDANRELRGGGL